MDTNPLDITSVAHWGVLSLHEPCELWEIRTPHMAVSNNTVF